MIFFIHYILLLPDRMFLLYILVQMELPSPIRFANCQRTLDGLRKLRPRTAPDQVIGGASYRTDLILPTPYLEASTRRYLPRSPVSPRMVPFSHLTFHPEVL